MSILTIGKPRIEKVNNNYRLVSEIKYNKNQKYDLWFEVEKEYKEYLCTENCDSFLVALIPYIIKHETDVVIDESSISSQLYYQLTNYLFPMLCEGYNKKLINIKCNISNYDFNSKGVGTGISCGVDSFYTLLKHLNLKDKSYNITHLTFFNAGSHGENGGDKARELYKKRLNYVKKFCNQYNYNLVSVDSNMNEFIKMSHFATHSFRTLGCVLALQKLFGKYYFASGTNFNDTCITPYSCAYYDILNVECLSNQNTTIYNSGIETTRMGKIKYLSKFEETYNWLNVCISEDDEKNCSLCEKCTRTMVALESINKLEQYKNVFDLNLFYKNRRKVYTNVLRKSRNKDTKDYYLEIINSCKDNGVYIPISSYVLSCIPTLSDIKKTIKRLIPKKILIKIRKKRGTYENGGWI